MKSIKQKIFLIFLIMMLAIPIISFNVGATNVTLNTQWRVREEFTSGITVRSDGVMFAFGFDAYNPMQYRFYSSSNNGVNWTLESSLASSQSNSFSACIGVDSNDDVHLFYIHSDGSFNDIYHRIWYANDTMGATEYIINHGSNQWVSYGYDVVFDSDNMYFFWSEHDATNGENYLRFRAYNFVLETWGSTVTLDTFHSFTSFFMKPSAVIYDDDVYVFYEDESGTNAIYYAQYHGFNTSWTYNHVFVDSSTYVYHRPCAVLYDGSIFVCYTGNTSVLESQTSLLYKTYDGTISGETILHSDSGYHQKEPSLSVNSNGDLNVVWSGRSALSTAYYQLRQKILSSGSWSDTAFVTGGATDKRYCDLCYQDYPTFTWLTSGVAMVYGDDTNDDFEYIDSGSLIWYGAGSGSTSSQYGDLSMYESIGDTTAHSWLTLYNARYVEEQFLVNMQCNITAVDLLVGGLQYDDDSDITNYFLKISDGSSSNTYECGNPTYFFDCGNGYILRWIFDTPFDTDGGKPTFEFIHNKGYLFHEYIAWWFFAWQAEPEYTYRYWYLGVDDTDLDNDGDIIFKVHDATALLDGVYNGDSLGYDVSYKFYYENLQFYEGHNYTDSILIDKTTLKRYEETLNIDAFSSDGTVPNQIRIFNVDTSTEVTNDSFPITFTEEDFKCSHTPEVLGNFNVSLYRGGVCKATETFTVTESTQSAFLIYTTPSTTNPNEQFRLRYRYNHSASAQGCIFLSRYPFVSSSYIERWYITENTADGVFDEIYPLQLTTSGVYYFIMCCEVSNGTYAPITGGQSLTKHTVRSQVANSLEVAHTNIVLGQEQIITGYHNHVGSNVMIRFNGVNEHAVGVSSAILISYYPEKIGMYLVELVLVSANGSQVLASIRFSVSEAPEQADEFNYVYRMIFDLFGLMGVWIAGGVVVVAFMIMPLYLTKKYDLPEIPKFAYFGFAVVGMILAVVFQFWAVWTILAMIIAVTGGCILEYYKKQY